MVRASAYPTVEWLTRTENDSLSATRDAAHRSGWSPSLGLTNRPSRSTSRTAFVDRIQRALNDWKCPGTRILRSAWIRTPNGEESVDLVIERKRRRIGIRLTHRFERDCDQSDALVLVYGRFDTLYRISEDSSADDWSDFAYTILAMVPSWFTADGRVAAGRQASSAALLGSDRLAWSGMVRLTGGSITRIRLSRASDWVSAFESALSTPRLISYADARNARPRR